VRFWLQARGIEAHPILMEKILAAAKRSNSLLAEEMILRMVRVMRERLQDGKEITEEELDAVASASD